jgi:hypothetical protein
MTWGVSGAADVVAQESTTRPLVTPSGLPTELEDARIFHAVAGSIRRDLKLPLPHVDVEVVDKRAFVEILATWGRRAELARESRHATAVALGHRTVVQSDHLASMSAPERAMLYAHELAHIAQAHLQLGGGHAQVWMLEGHAEWVSRQVVDRLGYRSYARSRAEVEQAVCDSPVRRERFPTLTKLETMEAWVPAAARLGWTATYGQAFLAIDRLVERYTEYKLHELFRRFRAPEARLHSIDAGGFFGDPFGHRAWSAVFPVPYRDFVAEFRAHLATLR